MDTALVFYVAEKQLPYALKWVELGGGGYSGEAMLL